MADKQIAKPLDDMWLNESDIMMIMMMTMMVYIMSAFIQPITQNLQAQSYEGVTDPREVDAGASLKWIDLIHGPPRTPWSFALIRNEGPNDVEVGINNPNERFVVYPGIPVEIDRRQSSQRISILFFICKPTESAFMRVTGEY